MIGGFILMFDSGDEKYQREPLTQKILHSRCWDLAAIAKAFAGNDFKPDHGFTQLFQRNLHLLNEVFAGFCALSFAMI